MDHLIIDLKLMSRSQTCSIIYISTDTDPAAAQRITTNVPWLKMTFHDNSDFAPLVKYSESPKIVEIEDVARGEDFVQAGVSLTHLQQRGDEDRLKAFVGD